jgi:hypothetical protein
MVRFNVASSRIVLEFSLMSERVAQCLFAVSRDMAKAYGVKAPTMAAIRLFLQGKAKP